ncbi:MAG TPA: ATP-binding protein [Bacteroidota bacterium]|nr:ATP-binding protein [Bacteroidota bacterium]
MKPLLRILIVEDSNDDAFLTLRLITAGGYEIEYERVETAEEMHIALTHQPWDVILSDYHLPCFDGLRALALAHESGLDIPFIIISGRIGEEVAVEAMKAGARDYIMKDHLQRLLPAIEREVLAAKDRTARKLLEEKEKLAETLRESEEKQRMQQQVKLLNYSLDHITEGVFLSDLDGRFLYINDEACRALGYSREELLKKHTIDLVRNESRTDWIGFVCDLEEYGSLTFEVSPTTKDGNVFPVEVNVSHFIYDHTAYILALTRDITERKKAEAEIQRKNEELVRLNTEKDKFFSIIAHDLRSPFNYFLGLTKLMAENIHSFTMDELQALAVKMKDSAANLFRLLENLLEWARMQQGIIPFRPELLCLRSVAEESMALMREPAQQKGIHLTCEAPEDLMLHADRAMLQTVIRNLVSNAVKFTPTGGSIILTGKTIAQAIVQISITDTGIGMNRAMIDNLFRLDVRTTRKGTAGEPSTGLGLLLCKEFVEKHGGKLWVESETGRGTTFHFTIQ